MCGRRVHTFNNAKPTEHYECIQLTKLLLTQSLTLCLSKPSGPRTLSKMCLPT